MLRKKSLECIVGVVQCMKIWSKELYVNPQQLSNLGEQVTFCFYCLPTEHR